MHNNNLVLHVDCNHFLYFSNFGHCFLFLWCYVPRQLRKLILVLNLLAIDIALQIHLQKRVSLCSNDNI